MEIERKFLVKTLPKNLDSYSKKELEQTYISISPTIRLRRSDDEFFLTVKGSGSIAREEFELTLSSEQYQSLMKKAETPSVKKTRYLIPLDDGHTAELDIYHNGLEGLLTVEVEFENIEAALSFIPPAWFGNDVSEDNRYKNTSLALWGMPKNTI